jgi:hypothetical protein
MIINKEVGIIIKKGTKMLVLFFSVFICGGVMYVISKFYWFLTIYGMFLSPGNSGFSDKFRQFTHFIISCFIAPCSQVISDGENISYQLCEKNNSLNMFGIIILGLSVLSGYLFRHKYIAKISIYWIGFAFALICLVGWGTTENGTVLYSLYFFWAFMVLLILLIDRLTVQSKYLKHFVCCIVFIALMVYNIINMLDIIHFGIKYYPVS